MGTIVIVTFDDVDQAKKSWKGLEEARKEKLVEFSDTVIITKDEKGKVKVKETADVTTKGGIIRGGAAGLIIGIIVGGPIGGALLGAAAGGLIAKKVDLGIANDKIEMVVEQMHESSSAILTEIEGGNVDLIKAAVRESGGELLEVGDVDELHVDVDETLSTATGHHQ